MNLKDFLLDFTDVQWAKSGTASYLGTVFASVSHWIFILVSAKSIQAILECPEERGSKVDSAQVSMTSIIDLFS